MLRCISCGRTYPNDYDISDGCACGAKVFILVTDEDTGNSISIRTDACCTDTKDAIENIRIKENGVFEIDIKRLMDGLVIVKDEMDVYYIRLPINHLNKRCKK